MGKIEKVCFVISGVIFTVAIVCFIIGLNIRQKTAAYRAENVKYVAVSTSSAESSQSPTEPSTSVDSRKKVIAHISADDAAKLVEESDQWNELIASIKNVMYTLPKLESVTSKDGKFTLTYTLECSQGIVKCTYNSINGKIKVGKVYNRIDEKYPVLIWHCGHIIDTNSTALEVMYNQGLTGVYMCEGSDGDTEFYCADNDENVHFIQW